MNEIDINGVWEKVVDDVKHRVIHPTLWRALEVSHPVTIDGDTFVVGFEPVNYNMSGHLTTAEHRNAIEISLREHTGRPFRLRVIEGTSIEDWQHILEKEAEASKFAESLKQKKDKEFAITKTWDNLYDQIGRKYANLKLRLLPQYKAQFIEEVVVEISNAMDELIPRDKEPDEVTERSLARVIDRAATLADVQSPVVALELRRYRRERR